MCSDSQGEQVSPYPFRSAAPVSTGASATLCQSAREALPPSTTLFVPDRGRGFAYTTVRIVFRQLARGLTSNSGRAYVRLHDLRHTFACRVLLRFQRSKQGAEGRIAVLSRYLGHKRVSDTYWYLTGTPDLLRQTTRTFLAPRP
jgi:integrase